MIPEILKNLIGPENIGRSVQSWENFFPTELSYIEWYYFLNRLWYYTNIALILPVMIACLNRYMHPAFQQKLWTDHLARAFLVFGAIFYIAECIVKYPIDGSQAICMKAMYIHHFAGVFILSSLFRNSYIPWWTCPLGFMHGVCIAFPDSDLVNLLYGGCLVIFQAGIYRKEYMNFPHFGKLRYFTNFIWVFAIMLYLGDCSNYMPLYKYEEQVW